MLSEDVLEKYYQAGKIAAKTRQEIKKTVREGMPIIQICDRAEEIIRTSGGKPAFPCNVSVSEIAAHYTSPPDDNQTVPEDSIVKIDIGVHIDGYIADTAVTVSFNPRYEDMVRAAEEALERATRSIRPEIPISQIGSEIQRTIEGFGFRPVSNLTGHQVGRYLIHTGKSLPNVSHFSLNKIHAGEVCAIEPFVTLKEAKGMVENGPEAYIFRFVKNKSVKGNEAKRLLKFIEANFRTLPFAERWLGEFLIRGDYRSAFSELFSSKSLVSYPVFVEASRKPVAQAEHTVYVDKEKAIILT